MARYKLVKGGKRILRKQGRIPSKSTLRYPWVILLAVTATLLVGGVAGYLLADEGDPTVVSVPEERSEKIVFVGGNVEVEKVVVAMGKPGNKIAITTFNTAATMIGCPSGFVKEEMREGAIAERGHSCKGAKEVSPTLLENWAVELFKTGLVTHIYYSTTGARNPGVPQT